MALYAYLKSGRLRILLFAILMLFSLALLSVPAQAVTSTQVKYDYFFLVDTSGSMAGLPANGNNQNIFPEVKTYVKSFIDDIDTGSAVYIIPFHQGVQGDKGYVIKGSSERSLLKGYVDDLKADGQVTWIYYTLRDALDKARAVREADPVPHIQTILLYTDGKDNGPEDASINDIIAKYKLEKSDNKYLYLKYFALVPGVDCPQILNNEVGVDCPPPGIPDPPQIINITPTEIHLGNIFEKPNVTLEFTASSADGVNGQSIDLILDASNFSASGANASIDPRSVRLAGNFSTQFSVSGVERLAKVDSTFFSSTLRFVGNDNVFFQPPEVLIDFTVQEPPKVSLRVEGGGSLTRNLGELSLSKGKIFSSDMVVLVNRNEIARNKEIRVGLDLLNDPDNPVKLDADQAFLSVNGSGEKAQSINLMPDQDTFKVEVAGHEELPPGKYSLSLRVMAEDAQLIGEGLDGVGKGSGERIASIQLTIPEPPLPFFVRVMWALFWLILILLTLLVIYSLLTRQTPLSALSAILLATGITKLKIQSGEFEQVTPETERPVVFDIAGFNKVKIGKDGDYLGEASSSIEIKPAKSSGNIELRMYPSEGNIRIIRQGESIDTPVIMGQNIYDGDVIMFDNDYRLRFSSMDAIRAEIDEEEGVY